MVEFSSQSSNLRDVISYINVNRTNAVPELSEETVAQVFKGKVTYRLCIVEFWQQVPDNVCMKSEYLHSHSNYSATSENNMEHC